MSALTSDNLERLSAMGLSMEQIIEVARMFERQRSPNAIRQARYREAHKGDAERNVTSDVTSNATGDVTPLSPSPSPPDPPNPAPIPEKLLHARKASKTGHRIADDWTPTADDRAFAKREGLTLGDTDREADQFRDYWRSASGRNATKLDWGATWRNWIRTGANRRGGPSAPRPATGGNRPEARSMAEIVARRRAADRAGGSIPGEPTGVFGGDLRPGDGPFAGEPIEGSYRVADGHDATNGGSGRGLDSHAARGNGAPDGGSRGPFDSP